MYLLDTDHLSIVDQDTIESFNLGSITTSAFPIALACPAQSQPLLWRQSSHIVRGKQAREADSTL
jgi:hypothetical protein